MPDVKRKSPPFPHVQSVIVPIKKNTPTLKKWLEKYSFKLNHSDKTEKNIKYRQYNPSKRMKYMTVKTHGVMFIVAYPKK